MAGAAVAAALVAGDDVTDVVDGLRCAEEPAGLRPVTMAAHSAPTTTKPTMNTTHSLVVSGTARSALCVWRVGFGLVSRRAGTGVQQVGQLAFTVFGEDDILETIDFTERRLEHLHEPASSVVDELA